MNVNLRSAELRKELQSDVLTPNISDKLVNNLTIRLTGPISDDLLMDIKAIAYDFPKLLRHVRIVNSGAAPIDLQELIDHIADLRRVEPRFNLIEELKIETPFESDLQGLDLSHYGRGKDEVKVQFAYRGSGRAKVAINRGNLSKNIKYFRESGLDLAGSDLTGTNLTGLTISGDGEVHFNQIQGLDQISELEITDRQTLGSEFESMLRYVRTSSKIHTFSLDRVNLEGRSILDFIMAWK